jgi:hypothetical protein
MFITMTRVVWCLTSVTGPAVSTSEAASIRSVERVVAFQESNGLCLMEAGAGTVNQNGDTDIVPRR